jgi:hypothetical protein
MASRLPAHVEVSGLLRTAQANGDFGMVLHKGERDGGTILIVFLDNQGFGTLFERMPQLDGNRQWSQTRSQTIDNKQEFEEYLSRRMQQDPDVWIVELTVAKVEQFVRDHLSQS